jgi:hypothetical protein
VGSRLCEVTIHRINLRGANSRPVASRAIAHMESPRPLPAWSTSTLSVHLNTPVVIVKTLGSTAVIDPASMVWGMHIINLLPSPIIVENYVDRIFPCGPITHTCRRKGVVPYMATSLKAGHDLGDSTP